MNTSTPSFRSYKVTTKKGNLMLVINAGVNPVGQRVLKVRPMRYAGCTGIWERVDAQYTYGDPIWIKESAVK